MSTVLSKPEIRRAYDHVAPRYDLIETWPVDTLFGLRKMRRQLFSKAQGRVLEVATGTGANLPFIPERCDVTAVDLSRGMLDRATRRAQRLDRHADFRIMDVEQLQFPKHSFDTVTGALGLCTYLDPEGALMEMGRVVKPGGRILLLEHGVSRFKAWRRLQHKTAPWHAKFLGCQWDRDPLDLVRRAGLDVEFAQRWFLGVFYALDLKLR